MFKTRYFFVFVILLSGCATMPHVPPTHQELVAASSHKPKAAIVEFANASSGIRDVQSIALTKLENALIGQFVLSERMKINQVLYENQFTQQLSAHEIRELGRRLGVDYLIFGDISAAASGPELKHQITQSGETFRGNIWEEYCANADLNIKVIDAGEAATIFSKNYHHDECDEVNRRYLKDPGQFNSELEMRNLPAILGQLTHYTGLTKPHGNLLNRQIEQSVDQFQRDIGAFLPTGARVVQILSDKEIVLDVGSAYGIRPGQKVTVTSQNDGSAPFNYGSSPVKATLRISAVNSGLSSVASGKPEDIARIRPGDRVLIQ